MAYQRINFVDGELGGTPLDADNLNHMEDGIVANEEAIEEVSGTVDDLSTEVEGKQDALTFDNTPTTNSSNPVTSGGIKTALDTKLNKNNPSATGAIQLGTGASASSQYGMDSIAIGTNAKANSFNSTAVGHGAKTSETAQVVLGDYNVTDITSKLIIGGGSADDDRRTLLKFDNSTGDATFCAEVTDGSGNKLSDKIETSDVQNLIESILPTDSASGNPCVITDAFNTDAKSVKLTLNPVQDLHGYDKPWVGGAGKNKLIYPNSATNKTDYGVTFTVNSDGTITLNGTASQDFNYNVLTQNTSGAREILLNAGQIKLVGGLSSTTAYLNLWNYDGNGSSVASTSGASSAFTFTNSNASWNMVIQIKSGTVFNNTKMQIMIVPASVTDYTYAPYENICPISGRTEATLDRTGKNLLDPTLNTSSQVGVTFTNDNGVLTLNGTATQTTNLPIKMRINTGATFWLPAGEYIFSAEGLEKGVHVGTTYNGAYVQIAANINGNSVSFTINENTASDYKDGSKILVGLYIGIENGKTYANQKIYPMVRPSSITDATYEPYTGETYTIDLDGTRYGCSVHFETGVMTVTKAYIELDGSNDENWSKFGSGSASAYAMQILPTPRADGTDQSKIYAISDYLESIPRGSTWGNYSAFCSVSGSGYLVAGISTITTVEDWRTYLSNHPLHMVYDLFQPITVQLTPEEVTFLKGNNVLTTDADSIEASYSADIALFIQKSTSESSSNRSVDTSSLSKGGLSESTKEETKEEIKEEEPKEVNER